MKIAIVQSSAITKSKRIRMDAAFFLGTIDRNRGDLSIEKAKKAMKNAKYRLGLAIRNAKKEDERITNLIASGDVIPYEKHEHEAGL